MTMAELDPMMPHLFMGMMILALMVVAATGGAPWCFLEFVRVMGCAVVACLAEDVIG